MSEAAGGKGLDLEAYGMIGDCRTCAIVGANGSIDWLCLPRFDSDACFAALLGDARNGHWLIAPSPDASEVRQSRRYVEDSLVMETVFETDAGRVSLTDFMPVGHAHASGNSSVVRLVRGLAGEVRMGMQLCLRFDYGVSVPWVTRLDGRGAHANDPGITAIVGPDMVTLRTRAELGGRDMMTVSDFVIREGETMSFVMTHSPSNLPPPAGFDAAAALEATLAYWREWIDCCDYRGRWSGAVRRSLVTLKGLTYAPTGGIVAAATTSLPEQLGGSRNWDYRFCWLRDTTLTLAALMRFGFYQEAVAWRGWLHRSVAGSPAQVQIMYGIGGERRLSEWEVPWLAGYQGAAPVRIGNAAAGQVQLDVYGEVMESLHLSRRGKLGTPEDGWSLQLGILEHLEEIWEQPDEGMWEVRGGRKQFTFSKVMVWVAFDRMISDAQTYGLQGPVDRWIALRDTIHATVCREGYDTESKSFVQSFGSKSLDASLLLIPQVGFLPYEDERIVGTVAAIERTLLEDGFVLRYQTETAVDGLPPGEGAFLACTFWLANCLAKQGRRAEAEAIFDRLVALQNDLGLLSEEYDPKASRLVGNFPQAFSHVGLIGTAMLLEEDVGPRDPAGEAPLA